MTDAIRYEKDSDNIVTLMMDAPGQSANTMNQAYTDSMEACVTKLEQEENLAGVIIASAKKTFFAGGDLNDLVKATPEVAEEFMNGTAVVKNQLRRLEKIKAPVVAAINGAALGGGYEICLACNHRIAINNPKTKLGLPEVGLGLLPGFFFKAGLTTRGGLPVVATPSVRAASTAAFSAGVGLRSSSESSMICQYLYALF